MSGRDLEEHAPGIGSAHRPPRCASRPLISSDRTAGRKLPTTSASLSSATSDPPGSTGRDVRVKSHVTLTVRSGV